MALVSPRRSSRRRRRGRACFDRAILRRARLTGAQLPQASLVDADLTGADLDAGAARRSPALAGEPVGSPAPDGERVARGFGQGPASRREPQASHPVGGEPRRGEAPGSDARGGAASDGEPSPGGPHSDGGGRGSLLESHPLRGEPHRSGLAGAEFEEADVSRAQLPLANLSEARLSKSRFSGADMNQVNLSRACLKGADLSKADLTGARLVEAEMVQTNLGGAKLSHCELSRALVMNCNLAQAILTESRLDDAVFAGSRHEGIVTSNLALTPSDEAAVLVDDLEMVHLMEALLREPRWRELITRSSLRVALVIGRFPQWRRPHLDAIREEVRRSRLRAARHRSREAGRAEAPLGHREPGPSREVRHRGPRRKPRVREGAPAVQLHAQGAARFKSSCRTAKSRRSFPVSGPSSPTDIATPSISSRSSRRRSCSPIERKLAPVP